jgi:hypothetical protein
VPQGAQRYRGEDAVFLQIIDFQSRRYEEGAKHVEDWKAATKGKRTAKRSVVCKDRDNPDRYLNIVWFDSYEDAMRNSELPETQQLAEQLGKLSDEPAIFRNLDVVDEWQD